jgi:tRNA(fMet)-specific endonuclease VapC
VSLCLGQARRYGKVFAQLRREGTPIPINDVWIAACTLDSGAQLVTFDRHFDKVRGLDVVILDA